MNLRQAILPLTGRFAGRTVYHMIKSFRDGLAEKLFAGERIRQYRAFAAQAQRRLTVLNEADRLVDLRALPSNRFEALGGNRKGQYSLRINDQWRLCFRWDCRRPLGEKDDILLVQGDAIDVEIVDYHWQFCGAAVGERSAADPSR